MPRPKTRSNPSLSCKGYAAEIAVAVIEKIGMEFPDTAEGDLCHSIVSSAILDVCLPVHRPHVEHQAFGVSTRPNTFDYLDALRYLKGEMFHAQLAGVDPEWIRRCMKTAGIPL